MTTDISRKLAGTPPKEIDKVLRSQALQLGVGLNVKYRTCFKSGGGSLDLPTCCELYGNLARLPEVARMLQEAMKPASQDDIEAWLAELSEIVIRRGSDDISSEIAFEAYLRRLAEYPADVAYNALLVRTWQFWPTWDELKKVCDQLVSTRRVMLRAVQSEAVRFDDTDAIRKRPTRDQVEQILKGTRFDPKRMNCRAGCNQEEQDADTEHERHWFDTATPDSPAVAALERARQENELIRQSRDAMAKRTHVERKVDNG